MNWFDVGIFINEAWNLIGIFDQRELRSCQDLKPSQWEARESARMEAYIRIIDRFFEEN